MSKNKVRWNFICTFVRLFEPNAICSENGEVGGISMNCSCIDLETYHLGRYWERDDQC